MYPWAEQVGSFLEQLMKIHANRSNSITALFVGIFASFIIQERKGNMKICDLFSYTVFILKLHFEVERR